MIVTLGEIPRSARNDKNGYFLRSLWTIPPCELNENQGRTTCRLSYWSATRARRIRTYRKVQTRVRIVAPPIKIGERTNTNCVEML